MPFVACCLFFGSMFYRCVVLFVICLLFVVVRCCLLLFIDAFGLFVVRCLYAVRGCRVLLSVVC